MIIDGSRDAIASRRLDEIVAKRTWRSNR